jgi:hypothetical protein
VCDLIYVAGDMPETISKPAVACSGTTYCRDSKTITFDTERRNFHRLLSIQLNRAQTGLFAHEICRQSAMAFFSASSV